MTWNNTHQLSCLEERSSVCGVMVHKVTGTVHKEYSSHVEKGLFWAKFGQKQFFNSERYALLRNIIIQSLENLLPFHWSAAVNCI